ncbi:unnamed protein product, partial [Ectocarpus sp. 8 AP-2014]
SFENAASVDGAPHEAKSCRPLRALCFPLETISKALIERIDNAFSVQRGGVLSDVLFRPSTSAAEARMGLHKRK